MIMDGWTMDEWMDERMMGGWINDDGWIDG